MNAFFQPALLPPLSRALAGPTQSPWLHRPVSHLANVIRRRPFYTCRPSLAAPNKKTRPTSINPMSIIIPPSFDGTVHKPTKLNLTLTPEERAQRYAQLADPSIIDKLRADGQFPKHLWLFGHDDQRLTDFDIDYGNGPVPEHHHALADALDELGHVPRPKPGSLMQRLFGNDQDGYAEHYARRREENRKFVSEEWYQETRELAADTFGFGAVSMDFESYVRTTFAKSALESLSFDPRRPNQWDSAANRALYSPTYHAHISTAMAFMRNIGKYEFKVDISDVHEVDVHSESSFSTITGENAMLSTINTLHPRFFMRQFGPELHLHRRGDNVLDYYRENGYYVASQYLVDVAVTVSGTVSVSRAPSMATAARAGSGGTRAGGVGGAKKGSSSSSKNKKKKAWALPAPVSATRVSYESVAQDMASDRLVYREELKEHEFVLRMVSPAAKKLPRFDLSQVGTQPWKVWDVDYNVTEALLEHSKSAKDEEAPRYIQLGLP